jgi:hypothetical protein
MESTKPGYSDDKQQLLARLRASKVRSAASDG